MAPQAALKDRLGEQRTFAARVVTLFVLVLVLLAVLVLRWWTSGPKTSTASVSGSSAGAGLSNR